MTEKRFKLSEPNGAYLIDNDEPKYHWINDDDKIVECLNALHEENQELKAFIKQLTNDCGEIVLMNGMGYNVKKIFGDLE